MRKEVIAVLIATILNNVALQNAKGATCDGDLIKSVTHDGEIIVMNSGHVYQVLAGDSIGSMLWLSASDVTICLRSMSVWKKDMIYYEIINGDKQGEGGSRSPTMSGVDS